MKFMKFSKELPIFVFQMLFFVSLKNENSNYKTIAVKLIFTFIKRANITSYLTIKQQKQWQNTSDSLHKYFERSKLCQSLDESAREMNISFYGEFVNSEIFPCFF